MFRMTFTSAIVAVSIAIVASAASAATISHSAPKAAAPIGTTEATSPVSAMPYACNKAELNTRIEKRTCR